MKIVRFAMACLLALGWIATSPAHAEPEADRDEGRLERLPDGVRERVERFRNATPEERELRREKLLEELQDASPRQRRRLLRRERRLMWVLPKEEREKIRAENEAFREKHDLRSVEETRDALRELGRNLELDHEDRRALRSRFRELPRSERRALWKDIQRFREMPAAEREALEARLLELKSLGEEDREVVRENARRWAEMSEDKRERLREQWRKLRALPPEERSELLEKALAAPSGSE